MLNINTSIMSKSQHVHAAARAPLSDPFDCMQYLRRHTDGDWLQQSNDKQKMLEWVGWPGVRSLSPQHYTPNEIEKKWVLMLPCKICGSACTASRLTIPSITVRGLGFPRGLLMIQVAWADPSSSMKGQGTPEYENTMTLRNVEA
jgi:hypothetical protein